MSASGMMSQHGFRSLRRRAAKERQEQTISALMFENAQLRFELQQWRGWFNSWEREGCEERQEGRDAGREEGKGEGKREKDLKKNEKNNEKGTVTRVKKLAEGDTKKEEKKENKMRQKELQRGRDKKKTREKDDEQNEGTKGGQKEEKKSVEVRSQVQKLIVGIRQSQPEDRWEPLMENIMRSPLVKEAAAAEGQSERQYVYCIMQDILLQQAAVRSES
eukprot:TRINITY_DN111001_c0_g1_i1.p1 TRINITY_DN111001_c0_g1~~TRINITY_DN111001_c0_g1_i1.p1  ORF type:complete len:219 (-),score=63.19 TRINITY_DN111001_c0_g1_i1:133-789(-)